jgi:hypothetical protein
MSTFDDEMEMSLIAFMEMQMLSSLTDEELPLVISQIESEEAKQEVERRFKSNE